MRFDRTGMFFVALVVAFGSQATALAASTSAPQAGGQQVWVARDAGPHNAFDDVGGMAVSPDGSIVYVARGSNGAFVLVAHDAATGAAIWSVKTKDPGGGQLTAHATALSPDGSVLFVTGETELDVDTRATLTVAYGAAHGSLLWEVERGLGANTYAVPNRIAVSPNGTRVFVAGTQNAGQGNGNDYFTVGYEAGTGGEAWTETYDGSGGGSDLLRGLDVSADGLQVFVTGTSGFAPPPTDSAFGTVAYAASNGAQLWAVQTHAGIDDDAADVVASPKGGRVFVVGYGRDSTSTPYGFRLLAYRATDGTLTQSGGYDGGQNDFATDLAVDADGTMLYATGGAVTFLTVAFRASTLKSVWAKRYDAGHGFNKAASAAVSPDGLNVYVAGESAGKFETCFGDVQSSAYATVAYDASSGSQSWVARYNGLKRDPDQPHQVATSPDGSLVYVTGDSDTGCVGSDVATVAYQA